MAVTATKMALIVGALGFISFMFGIFAETKKPASGTPIPGKGVVICKYPSSPTVVFGYLSTAFLVASTVVGYLSLFYPYKGRSVPQSALFKNSTFTVFFNISLFTAGLGVAFLLWPTIAEQLILSRNVHHNLETDCPTAKTGLLGGGAFVSLDSSLFWLVALMLAINAREDYLDDTQQEPINGAMEMAETPQRAYI
ncbi:uncharacterized protein LOC109009603 [Juglans regia]|uniref:Uncharacterized protein LOC109009603 n=1 Tax=Juglans regia TaxID=51240 RepID=A0A2I4GP74_JUGRE|nr:uncharacterized protein LOC109009603 [Juglans regia]XP_018845697.1 uncharacterized protein LOC109009603 [Juglans regia]